MIAGFPEAAPPPRPVPIILDTDIGPDCDDAGAVAVLNALADRGEAKLLAMACCTSSEWGAPCVQAINTYYGRPDIPVGTCKREGFLTDSPYNGPVAREFPNTLKTGHAAPDARNLYREILRYLPWIGRTPTGSGGNGAARPAESLPQKADTHSSHLGA